MQPRVLSVPYHLQQLQMSQYRPFCQQCCLLCIHMSWIVMNSCKLTVVYFSIWQHKLVFLFVAWGFHRYLSFRCGKKTEGKMASSRSHCIYCESSNFCIISNDKPQLNPPPLAAPRYVSAWLFDSSLNQDSLTCRPHRLSVCLSYNIDDWIVLWIFSTFSMAVISKRIPNKRPSWKPSQCLSHFYSKPIHSVVF